MIKKDPERLSAMDRDQEISMETEISRGIEKVQDRSKNIDKERERSRKTVRSRGFE